MKKNLSIILLVVFIVSVFGMSYAGEACPLSVTDGAHNYVEEKTFIGTGTERDSELGLYFVRYDQPTIGGEIGKCETRVRHFTYVETTYLNTYTCGCGETGRTFYTVENTNKRYLDNDPNWL